MADKTGGPRIRDLPCLAWYFYKIENLPPHWVRYCFFSNQDRARSPLFSADVYKIWWHLNNLVFAIYQPEHHQETPNKWQSGFDSGKSQTWGWSFSLALPFLSLLSTHTSPKNLVYSTMTSVLSLLLARETLGYLVFLITLISPLIYHSGNCTWNWVNIILALLRAVCHGWTIKTPRVLVSLSEKQRYWYLFHRVIVHTTSYHVLVTAMQNLAPKLVW